MTGCASACVFACASACLCLLVCLRVCQQVSERLYLCMRLCVRLCVCLCACLCASACASSCVPTCVSACASVCDLACLSLSVYVSVCACAWPRVRVNLRLGVHVCPRMRYLHVHSEPRGVVSPRARVGTTPLIFYSLIPVGRFGFCELALNNSSLSSTYNIWRMLGICTRVPNPKIVFAWGVRDLQSVRTD